mgnify:FL=1
MSVLSLTSYLLWSGTTIGGGATLTSAAIDLLHVDLVEALRLRVSSVAGTANVRVEYQTSHNGTDWDEEDDNVDIVASTLLAKAGNAEQWNSFPMPAPLARYIRILVDEISAAVLTDTLVESKLLCREGLS